MSPKEIDAIKQAQKKGFDALVEHVEMLINSNYDAGHDDGYSEGHDDGFAEGNEVR